MTAGVEIWIHRFYLGTHGGEWSGSCTYRFTIEDEPPVPIRHEMGWASVGQCGVEKNVLALPGIEPEASSPWPVAIPT